MPVTSMKRFPIDLYLILDPEVIPERDLQQVAEEAMAGGVRMIQYRDKKGSKKRAYQTASRLLELTRGSNGVLLINDDVDLALAVGANGVHLGQEDLPIDKARALLGPERIIGGSARTFEQAVAVQEAGADYIGIGPIFSSPTKQVKPSLHPSILTEFRHRVRVPIFAIGGISHQNMDSVLMSGADGIACISAILTQPDIRGTVQRMLWEIRRIKKEAGKRAST